MTPEEAVRSYVYHPPAEEEDETRAKRFRRDLHDRQRRAAVAAQVSTVVAFLAVAILSFVIGKSI